jgi:hypothetical protein
MDAGLQKELDEQIKISKLLSRGFIFSIVWLGGIGSLVALVSGIKGLVLVGQSEGRLVGKKMAWWCILVGGIGVVILPWYVYSTGAIK